MKVFAVINQKGGTGKTTVTINLAAHLAARGRRVLVADMDPQGNATSGGGAPRRELLRGMYQALCGESAGRCVVGVVSGRHDILGAKAELAGAEAELPGQAKWQARLREALGPILPDYDFALIDCPPSLGALTVNALVAAEGVLVPMQCEYFALEGLSDLRRTILELRKSWNPGLRIAGIVRPMLDARNRLERDISAELDRHFSGLVFGAAIRRNVRVAEAPSYGMPVLTYAPLSAGAEGYRGLGDEFLERFGS